MNRGSTLRGLIEGLATYRFNEAPIHESGKCGRSSRVPGMRYCFNEAPIHESGKLDGDSARAVIAVRFNEAPIHESGKSSIASSGTLSSRLLQ